MAVIAVWDPMGRVSETASRKVTATFNTSQGKVYLWNVQGHGSVRVKGFITVVMRGRYADCRVHVLSGARELVPIGHCWRVSGKFAIGYFTSQAEAACMMEQKANRFMLDRIPRDLIDIPSPYTRGQSHQQICTAS